MPAWPSSQGDRLQSGKSGVQFSPWAPNMTCNEDKKRQLGMPIGTASYRLVKQLLFSLIEKTCFRCGQNIASVDELSIDHKRDWLHTSNPQELFFDLTNIAFSHKACNFKARKRKSNKITLALAKLHANNSIRKNAPPGKNWCYACQQMVDVALFTKHRNKHNGLEEICKPCKTGRLTE